MYVDNTKQFENVISFCSGYAGIERGLEFAGVEARTLAYVEIEAFACANLVAKMEANALAAAPIWTDLKTFPAHLFRDRVDIITGGYPCQPFSAAGKRAGKDDPRHLWPWIKEHIQAIRPVRCFFENVEGHISLGLREVIEDLEGLGYATTWGIFSAAEVGAPHQRKRVYILANSDSERQSGWPETNGRQTGQSVEGSAKSSLADSNDPRREQSNQEDAGRSSEQFNSSGFSSGDVSVSNSERLERRLYGSSLDAERWKEQEVRRSTECGDWGSWNGHQGWAFEPGLGRVVDGCADRVDRLRLLGNGVVPQTAAQAWITLNRQLQGKE